MTTDREELLAAVLSFGRADTEYRRANNTKEQPRLNRAGTRYAVAKIKMLHIAAALANPASGEG